MSIGLVFCSAGLVAQGAATFSMPGSLLLFGNYNDLRLVSPERAQVLRPPVNEGYNRGYFAYPSVAPPGDLIAWGTAIAWEPERPRYMPRFALGIYALAHQTWKT